MTSLTFLGAARTVTGSKHLLNIDGQRILFDCGLFQGLKELRLRNWSPLPVPPDTIDAVVLTHAHIDHSGWLPRLIAAGLQGARSIAPPAPPTSASWSCRMPPTSRKRTRSSPTSAATPSITRRMPLYTKEDAAEALSRLTTSALQAEVLDRARHRRRVHQRRPPAGFVVRACDAGDRQAAGGPHPVRRRPRPLRPADPSGSVAGVEADVLLVESTYGDRLHPAEDDGEALARIVHETFARRGKLIIPAFAIGRVEELLYWLFRLEDQKRVPKMPIYVDSPMALEGHRLLPGARAASWIRGSSSSAATLRGSPPSTRRRSRKRLVQNDAPADRHRLERHGHRRPRRASPVRRAAATRATPCCSSASRPPARAAAS